MNIFRNYIPHKTKKFGYKIPEWMNTFIISAPRKRSIFVKRYYRNLSEYNEETLLNQANECTKRIMEAKQKYIAKMSSKLDCPDTASKTYWSIINRISNKKRYQIYHLSLLTTNLYGIFIKKLNYLIDTLRKNALSFKIQAFNFKANNRLKSFEINENNLLLITKNPNAYKAHGWDDISIRMIQSCGKSYH